LLEALLIYLAEVHSLGSWTDDNLYRFSNFSGASVSNDPDDFFTHNKEDSKIKVDKYFYLKVRNTRNRLILF
jgi:hypothetical protein